MNTTRKTGEYYGIKHQVYEGLKVHLSQYRYVEKSTPKHFHEHPYLWYVLQGQMIDNSKKGKKLLPTGSLLLINWEDQHHNEKHSANAAGFHIEIDRNYFATDSSKVSLTEGNLLLEHPDIHHIVGKLYYEFRMSDHYSQLSIDILINHIGSLLSEQSAPSEQSKPEWIDKLTEILYHSDDTWSLSRLADELEIHPVHLSRTIPQYFKNGLGDFYRKRKIQSSLQLLHNRDLSLSYIAHEVGCYDQSHFTKLFKRFMGMTPNIYRKGVLSI